MAQPTTVRAGATPRGPMAHPAPGLARRPLAAVVRRFPGPVVGAIDEEAAELVGLVRRAAPRRRATMLVGLALLLLLAVGGAAGAAQPKPVHRSALEAFGAAASASAATTASSGAAANALASAPAASATPLVPAALADDPAFKGPDMLDLGAKTALVLALLFVTLRILRRVQRTGPAKDGSLVAVLETRSLGAKAQVHLVAIGDRRLVIGQSPSGLVALGELDAAELPVAEPAPASEPWARSDARDQDPDLEAQAAHELATGRRIRLGLSA